MIDLDVASVYRLSHGELGPKPKHTQFSVTDSRDKSCVVAVCRALVGMVQAYENLKAAIRQCGDCVRLNLTNVGMDPMCMAVVMAACMDATSDARDVYLDTTDGDSQMAIEDVLVRGLHDSYDTSKYISRIRRRLRRPAA